MARFTSVALVAVLVLFTLTVEASDLAPVRSRERILSTNGFSFLPPLGSNWSEQFGRNEISYLKQTDLRTVTFYAGAIEGKLHSDLSGKEALIRFVRSKKDEWGDDGRFSDISSSFQIEAQQESCVRYWLSAKDRKAKNKGRHEFLLMQATGRFCLHPQNRTVAVDIYYSVRHVPQFDSQGLIAEGEEFLKSLQFSKLPHESKGAPGN